MRLIALFTLTGCLATAGPSAVYNVKTGDMAAGWQLQVIELGNQETGGAAAGAGVAAGQSFGDTYTSFISLRGLVGPHLGGSVWERSVAATGEAGVSFGDAPTTVQAGVAGLGIDALRTNGEVHFVGLLELGIRYAGGGAQLYLSPQLGALFPAPYSD